MYGVRLKNGDELYHHGVKGMKWGKHLFGLARLKGNMTNTMETDTGTGANNKPESIDEHMKNYFAKRDARVKQQLETSAKKQEAARKAAAAAAAEKEAKKKKKSGSGGKKSSAKAKKEEEVEEEETKTEDRNEAEAKTPDIPSDLIEKIQDLHYQLTPEEVKIRSENGVAKAKELISTLPDDPTEDDIYDLTRFESDKRGVGYDAFSIGLAIETSLIKLYSKWIADPNSDEEKVMYATEQRKLHENNLKESLRTGRASY